MPRQGDIQRLLSIHLAAGAYKLQGRVFLICPGLNFVPESGGIFPAKIRRGHINCPNAAILYAPSEKRPMRGHINCPNTAILYAPSKKSPMRGHINPAKSLRLYARRNGLIARGRKNVRVGGAVAAESVFLLY